MKHFKRLVRLCWAGIPFKVYSVLYASDRACATVTLGVTIPGRHKLLAIPVEECVFNRSITYTTTEGGSLADRREELTKALCYGISEDYDILYQTGDAKVPAIDYDIAAFSSTKCYHAMRAAFAKWYPDIAVAEYKDSVILHSPECMAWISRNAFINIRRENFGDPAVYYTVKRFMRLNGIEECEYVGSLFTK